MLTVRMGFATLHTSEIHIGGGERTVNQCFQTPLTYTRVIRRNAGLVGRIVDAVK